MKYKQGNLEEARTFYEWAIASTEGAVGDKDALLAACLRDYAQVLRSLGRVNDATEAEKSSPQKFLQKRSNCLEPGSGALYAPL